MFMKKFLCVILFLLLTSVSVFCEEYTDEEIFDIKQNGFALYNTNHIEEASIMLNKIPNGKKDSEVYLILANIEEDKNNCDKALEYLKISISKDSEFYKGYYNLGCIFMKKKIYTLAIDNFELAVKYNKNNPFGFYNLGCAYLGINEFRKAKKNFLKALYLKNDEKDFYYNLAYANKKSGNEKQARKIIDFYNKTFIEKAN